MHVKKGDAVLVIAGNDKGKTGAVRTSLPGKNHVVVEGVNMRWRHKRPTQQSYWRLVKNPWSTGFAQRVKNLPTT